MARASGVGLAADITMLDAVFLLAGTVFFLVTAAYADGCDRL